MKYKFLVFLSSIFIVLLAYGAYAGLYGECLYGQSVYGDAECAAASSSSSGGGGGGGGGGSSGPSTSWFSGTSTYSVIDADTIADPLENTMVTTTCESSIAQNGRCSITAEEVPGSSSVSTSDLQGGEANDAIVFMLGESLGNPVVQALSPSELSQIAQQVKTLTSEGDAAAVKVLGGYSMKCTGEIGENTAEFSVDLVALSDFTDSLECDDITISTLDGSVKPATVSNCRQDQGNLKLNAAYTGCQNYVVVFAKGGQAVQTVPSETQAGTSEGTSTTSEQPSQTEAVKPSKLGLILVILGVIVILGVGYLVFRRKQHHF